MSKVVFDKLPKEQQDAIMEVGAELEEFGTEGAKADDEQVAKVYAKAGAKVYDLDEATLDKWRDRPRHRLEGLRRQAPRTAPSSSSWQKRWREPRASTARRRRAVEAPAPCRVRLGALDRADRARSTTSSWSSAASRWSRRRWS